MAQQRQWRPQMTDAERFRGWIFFALYVLVFPWMVGWIQRLVSGDAEPLVAEANLVYYGLLFLLTVAVFWTFLRHAFSLLLDWLPENLFAIVTGLLGAAALHFLVALIPLPVENPIYTDWPAEYAANGAATSVVVLVLMPVVEEVLFRGLVFGSLRKRSRLLAYVVTVVGYALACAWQFIFQPETGLDLRYLLLAVQYLPMSLSLAWCYDNGGSVWGAAALHTILNGVQLILTLQ